MSAEIIDSDGGLVTVKITGMLTQPEFSGLQQAVSNAIVEYGRVRVLVVVKNFSGWQQDGDWGDLSFQVVHDGHIEKMAIVGDRNWKDLALVFMAQGVRKFPIEYFEPGENAKARHWLSQTPGRMPVGRSS